ncbi:MAG: phosphatidylserine decarboxylase [Pseudomonadales bacterium]|nr:phosphatidylserine decarboxylase [Pseudomonadales bacterium]
MAKTDLKQKLFILLQYLVPQHLVSRLAGLLTESQIPWLKNYLIGKAIKTFHVNMAEAAEPNPRYYATFNDFFTRALAEGARPIDATTDSVVSPADGQISQMGKIDQGQLLQAKGKAFSLKQLLADDAELTEAFVDGSFMTVYLSPKDYHRVHMPWGGTLKSMTYVPGALFSVNQTTSEQVDGLFARNERVICSFDTERGPMVVILVGAMIVGSIETVWAGQIAPPKRQLTQVNYTQPPTPIEFKKGDEMGRFKMGSTAIVLFGEDVVEWDSNLDELSDVQVGMKIGTIG